MTLLQNMIKYDVLNLNRHGAEANPKMTIFYVLFRLLIFYTILTVLFQASYPTLIYYLITVFNHLSSFDTYRAR